MVGGRECGLLLAVAVATGALEKEALDKEY